MIVPGEEELDEAIGEIIDSLLKNGPNAQSECKALLGIIAGQPIRRRHGRGDDATRGDRPVRRRKDTKD